VGTGKVKKMMSRWLAARKKQVAGWLRQGISPQRLALTIALGFAIGCIPLVGLPTPLCALLALALRLNLPAIQTANYAAMPLQVVLVFPFIRLGGWLFSSDHRPALTASALLHGSPLKLLWASGGLAEQAMLAWVVIAVPAVALMTLSLTALLRRVPAVAEAGD
jgi:uncharacterized protein (DUF2062 family)